MENPYNPAFENLSERLYLQPLESKFSVPAEPIEFFSDGSTRLSDGSIIDESGELVPIRLPGEVYPVEYYSDGTTMMSDGSCVETKDLK